MRIPGAELVSRLVSRATADFQPPEITGPYSQGYTLEDHAETFKDDIDELRKKLPNVHMADVMRDVNRSARTTKCPIELPTSDAVGFCWNKEDTEGTTWIPQGLSASWDADADGNSASTGSSPPACTTTKAGSMKITVSPIGHTRVRLGVPHH